MPTPLLFRSRRFALLLLTGLVFPALCPAALTWENPRIDLTTKPGDKQAVGLFRFTNSGNAPVTISSVQSSCGCTTAELDKKTYAPGESGEIKAVFTVGDRVGEQEKSIFVVTSDAGEKAATLVLHVTIPELLRYSPRLLMWKTGEKPDEKAIEIATHSKLRITSVEIIGGPTPEVKARVEPVDAGVSYHLFAHPVSTATSVNAPVAGIATFEDGTTQPFTIYVLVR